MVRTVFSGEAALALEGRVMLWTLGTSGHAIECLAQRHPLGLELRYVMDGRVLMSRVFETWERLFNQAVAWREGLEQHGWPAPDPTADRLPVGAFSAAARADHPR